MVDDIRRFHILQLVDGMGVRKEQDDIGFRSTNKETSAKERKSERLLGRRDLRSSPRLFWHADVAELTKCYNDLIR